MQRHIPIVVGVDGTGYPVYTAIVAKTSAHDPRKETNPMKHSTPFSFSPWRIEDLLFRFDMAAFRLDNGDAKDCAQDIAWYVRTDRASLDWIRALDRATPQKLLRRMMQSPDSSTQGRLKVATDYLRRYCEYV